MAEFKSPALKDASVRCVAAKAPKPSGVLHFTLSVTDLDRARKFYEEVVLLSQNFVVDPERTVEQVLKDLEKTTGGAIHVSKFVVFRLGEGIERETSDFAAEVAAAAGNEKGEGKDKPKS